MNKFFVIVLSINMLVISSCINKGVKIDDIKYTKGFVDSTKHLYYWSSYYSLKIYYHYSVNDSVYATSYINPNSKEYSYTASFYYGDSILVGYSEKDPLKSKIIKRTYIKSKDYHVP